MFFLAIFDQKIALFVRDAKERIFLPKNYTKYIFPIYHKGLECYEHPCGKVEKTVENSANPY